VTDLDVDWLGVCVCDGDCVRVRVCVWLPEPVDDADWLGVAAWLELCVSLLVSVCVRVSEGL
jgi:hypothetical protein